MHCQIASQIPSPLPYFSGSCANATSSMKTSLIAPSSSYKYSPKQLWHSLVHDPL